jgi:predicted nucleotidyltransferase
LSKASAADYSQRATERCERVLVTVLGNIGPWAERVYLAGGLAPRYLIAKLPPDVPPHVGSTDVDLIISVAVTTNDAGAYRTLHHNLRQGGFTQGPADFQWRRKIDESTMLVEFLCETDAVAAGRIFKPKQDYGSKMAALNVTGTELAHRDYVEVALEAERLDDGGRSRVTVRVANLLPLVVLKIAAFQDRHANKDAYDLIFTLRNWPGGPDAAGRAAAESPVAAEKITSGALALLGERFADTDQDGPAAYATFTAVTGTDPNQMRQEAVAVARQFLRALTTGSGRTES